MKMIVMLNFPRPLGALLCTSSLLLAAACGAAEPGGGSPNAQPGQLTIVTAFYPFQFIAERVAGSHATVQSLTQPGAEPHDVELTPKQVAALSTAELVIYEKSFQAAVDEAVAQSGNEQVLETTTVVPLQPLGAPADDHGDGEEEEHGHADEPAGDEAAGDEAGADVAGGDEVEADYGDLDPHVWLDPTNVAIITQAVAEQLSGLDSTHAADYAANAASLETELRSLDQEFSTGLATCKRTEFITTHAAFGYLAKRYRLDQIGISGLSPDSEPSPARIAEVHAEAREHGITTIFYETLVSPAVAQSIAGDLQLKTDVLDPIEGITADSAGQDYLSVMKANLTALKTANQCR